MAVDTVDVVQRIWARDAGLWTGADEDRWLGWLDEPARMRARVDELQAFAQDVHDAGFREIVLAGMGGSSLAPEVVRRTFGSDRFHVLDTTHPGAVRALEERLDLERTLFLVASKSGSTLETQCHLAYFWEKAGGRGEQFATITDPGSELERRARESGFRAVFGGEPSIGGRYSALSVFGMVPAVLMGVDLERLLLRAEEMVEACRGEDGNPGLELGERLGAAWRDGRDKVLINPDVGGFGLWAEQLLAESTGKEGKGLVPVPGETEDGQDRQREEVRVTDPYELGQEFYRWEFATAVTGAVMEINPFDQPNVQEAKDRAAALLAGNPGDGAVDDLPFGSLAELLASAEPPEYVAIQAFIDPARAGELEPLVTRARETGCVVTHGLGPRYLHSTGQLHKGGPATGRFVQVVDDVREDVHIPGRPYTFGTLIAAQMVGDAAALLERGRPVVRVRLEEIA
jgi:glucose-6-phosphate isomerase